MLGFSQLFIVIIVIWFILGDLSRQDISYFTLYYELLDMFEINNDYYEDYGCANLAYKDYSWSTGTG